MPDKTRNIAPRFRIGDIVEISESFNRVLRGRFGRIVEIRANEHSQLLDKYLVLLNDTSEEQLLWDIELRRK